jgi:hypothetical protein
MRVHDVHKGLAAIGEVRRFRVFYRNIAVAAHQAGSGNLCLLGYVGTRGTLNTLYGARAPACSAAYGSRLEADKKTRRRSVQLPPVLCHTPACEYVLSNVAFVHTNSLPRPSSHLYGRGQRCEGRAEVPGKKAAQPKYGAIIMVRASDGLARRRQHKGPAPCVFRSAGCRGARITVPELLSLKGAMSKYVVVASCCLSTRLIVPCDM